MHFIYLIESSHDLELSYGGIELLNDYLIELFLEDPIFFIKQSVRFNDKSIVKYIMSQNGEYLVKKNFFDENMGFIEINDKQLLLNHEFEKEISDENLNLKLKKLPKINVVFSPSLYSEWENKTVSYTKSLFKFYSIKVL